jgi:hypothetical protein
LAGFICAPQTFSEKTAGTSVRRAQKKSQSAGSIEIMKGFPPKVTGRVLFIDKDNLNTDGIYGSKHTYRDDMTPDEMAAVTFENYDPNFNTLYQKGDVVVGGLNFGSAQVQRDSVRRRRQFFRNLQAQRVQQRFRRVRMSRTRHLLARSSEESRTNNSRFRNHDRLCKINTNDRR